MLKKVIIGIVCCVVLTITGLGIYIYTLDWNKHKALVAERFSQITGLKAVIDGNLSVEIFPSPKFSAASVKFSKNNSRSPLFEVEEISANVELMPMFSNNFILSSMTLKSANVFLNVNEKGELNWSGVGSGSKNKSGNIEVSFSDVRLINSMVSYDNKKTGDNFNLPNISANINAKSLEGPYNINGKFIRNNSEISFIGDVVNNKNITLRLSFANPSTSTKFSIDGTVGNKAKGNVSFDSKSFYDIVSVLYGENKISEIYDQPLLVSFTYEHDNKLTKLDNFTVKYGNSTAGSGIVKVSKTDKVSVEADLDMLLFDLELLENLSKDVIKRYSVENNETQNAKNDVKYDLNLNIKSNFAKYKNADAQKLMLGIKYANNVVNLDRFSIVMPGETQIKSVGKVNLTPKIEYILNQTIDSKDLRIFASVFGLDIAKYASTNNLKSIFKRAQAEMMISGDLGALKISVPQAVIDATSFSGNLGFIFSKEKPVVLLQAEADRIIFDKYFKINVPELKNAPLENKVVYQLAMAPWKGNFETDVTFKADNIIYNNVAIDNLDLHFVAKNDNIEISKFHSTSLGGAEVDVVASATNIYKKPYLNELTFNVKTNNFPFFAKSLGIDTGKKGLFMRKLFATQGVMNGSLSDFSLSSIQKFGDVEFSYTGDVVTNKNNKKAVKGNVEFKTDNFSNFVKAIGFDYTPDIPLTAFTLTGDVEGLYENFNISQISAYLGTNHIEGNLSIDNSQQVPMFVADVNFDKFDINRMFNIKKNQSEKDKENSASFIANPQFNDDKIDLSYLSKVNFNVNSKIKQLGFNNENFSDANIEGTLKDGILDITKFKALKDGSEVSFNVKVNSNNIPKIEGNFDVAEIKTPSFGGSVYSIDNGIIDAQGSFNSLLGSKKEFFENLNSKGSFKLYGVALNGWDLDIIKFELEQRNTVDGFKDTVINSLKNGKSSFDEIKGRYEVAKGVIVADNITWNSPVITMNMACELNLNDWKFNSSFNAFYKNASFSDVLKFSFDGDLAEPEVKADLEESIQRIASIEANVEKIKADKEKEQNIIVKKKMEALISNIKIAKQNIKRMSLDVARYKPLTNNVDVVKVYENNIKDLKLAEEKLNQIEKEIELSNDEKELMDLEATLAKETARFTFIPKVLEENYVVDSKYVFDDVFNKITWLFNLAQNNSSYYNSLTEVYLAQIELLKTTENPVDEKVVDDIKKDMEIIAGDIEKISKLHSKIRDNYLDIIDTTSISKMKENNNLAEQALSTMFVYVKQLNNSLINSIDAFRIALGIKAKDYDLYMVYPPEKVADIDISMPTTKNGEKVSTKTTKTVDTAIDETKKKDRLAFSMDNFSKGISNLMDKLNNRKKAMAMSNMEFSGISNAITNGKDALVNVKEKENPKEVAIALAQAEEVKTSEDVIEVAQAKEVKPNEDVIDVAQAKEVKPNDEVIEIAQAKEVKPNDDIIEVAQAKEVKPNDDVVEVAQAKEVKPNDDIIEVAQAKEVKPNDDVVEVAQAKEVKPNEDVVEVAQAKENNQNELKFAMNDKEIEHIDSLASNLIDKTKSIISGFVSKITNKENPKEEIKLADISIDVNKIAKEDKAEADIEKNNKIKEEKNEVITESNELKNSTILRVNPVIAMNIGNNDGSLNFADIPSIENKKKGFEKKGIDKDKSIENVENVEKIVVAKVETNTDISKDEFLKMFRLAKMEVLPDNNQQYDVVLENSENNHNDIYENRYIKISSGNIPHFRGIVGKTATVNNVKDNVVMKDKKHLFAPQYKKIARLEGKIGKKFTLPVK